jgi:ketosteroid isomerase-like protein
VIWETTDSGVIIAEYEVVGTITASDRAGRLKQLMVLRARDGEILLTRSYFSLGELADLLRGE